MSGECGISSFHQLLPQTNRGWCVNSGLGGALDPRDGHKKLQSRPKRKMTPITGMGLQELLQYVYAEHIKVTVSERCGLYAGLVRLLAVFLVRQLILTTSSEYQSILQNHSWDLFCSKLVVPLSLTSIFYRKRKEPMRHREVISSASPVDQSIKTGKNRRKGGPPLRISNRYLDVLSHRRIQGKGLQVPG